MEELKEKRAALEEERRRKQRAREQREREKEQRERERAQEREREQERSDTCAACKLPTPPESTEDLVEWVQCEYCTLWYHMECVSHVVPEEAWLCRKCALSHDI